MLLISKNLKIASSIFLLLMFSGNTLFAQGTLVGPVYPPPLGANYSITGGYDAIGKTGGITWIYSNVNLVTHDVVYWGLVDGSIKISMDNNTYTTAEILDYRPELSNLASGVMIFTGTTNFYGSSVLVYTKFTVRVTNLSSITLPLQDASTIGLPENVGAVGSLRSWGVTSAGYFRVNMIFEASYSSTSSYIPAFTFFNTYKSSVQTYSSVYSSVNAGFYYLNSPPQLERNNSISMQEGQTVTIPSTALRASDVESSINQIVFTVGPVSGGHVPAHGTLRLNGIPLSLGSTFTQDDINRYALSYRHDGGISTSDNFTFTIRDGQGTTVPTSYYTFNIQIGQINNPPVAVNDTGSVIAGTTFYGRLSASDPDVPVQTLSFTLVRNGNKGTANLLNFNDGSFSYLPLEDAFGSDTLFFQVSDGLSSSTVPGLFIIRIINNLAPVILPIADQTMEEKETRNILVQVNDPDGNTILITVNNLPSFGTFSAAGNGSGVIHLSPAVGDAGNYPGIEIIATDNGRPARASQEDFTLTVIPEIKPFIIVSPANSYDFRTVQLGSDSILTVRIRNSGTGQLILQNVFCRDDNFDEFTIDDPGYPLSIDMGDSIEIIVHFTPVSQGSKHTILVIDSNDPVNDLLSITLHGLAVYPSADVTYTPGVLKGPPSAVIEFPVFVDVDENKPVCAFGFNLVFKSNILSYQHWTPGSVIPADGFQTAATLVNDSTLNISGFRKYGPAMTQDGPLAMVAFLINPSAPMGDTELKIALPSAGDCQGLDMSVNAYDIGRIIVDIYAYLNGKINYFDPYQAGVGRPVANIPVILQNTSGVTVKQTVTDENGFYQLDSVLTLHDYILLPKLVDDVSHMHLAVNSTDAYRAFSAVNGTLPFPNPYQYEVGDVNNSNSFNSTDAFVIFQLGNYQIPNLRSFGLDDWNFVPISAMNFSKCEVNYLHAIELPYLLRDQDDLDFIAGINGDVNGTGNSINIPKIEGSPVKFTIAVATVPVNGQIQIPVHLETNGQAICALQFEITYNHNDLEYAGYGQSELTPDSEYWLMYLEEKPDFKIYLAAFVMDVNQAIQQDGDLLYLNFKLKSGSGQSVETELSFTESPLAGGADGFDLPVDWENGVVSIEKSVLPDEMVLKQNYPNPFNPSTIIEFSLPQAGAVTLTIYNIVGEAISVVVNQDLQPGVYRYNWDGSAFASGIYYYRLETNGHVMTKKLVMLH